MLKMNTSNFIYTTYVVDADGELAVEFPDEMMDILNLKVGDKLTWNKIDVFGKPGWVLVKEDIDDGHTTDK